MAEEEFEEFEEEPEEEEEEPKAKKAVAKKPVKVVEEEEEPQEKQEKKAVVKASDFPQAPQPTITGEDIVAALQNHEQRLTTLEAALFRMKGAI